MTIFCLDCKSFRTLDFFRYTEEQKKEILKTYKERSSLRGLRRIYGVAPEIVISWIKKNQFEDSAPREVLIIPQENDILEFDEMWSFVYCKVNKAWLWFAICRRTKQIVAWFLGKRNQYSANQFFKLIPKEY